MVGYAKLYFMPITERPTALQPTVLQLPNFAWISSLEELPLRHEAILSLAEVMLVQAESTRNALIVLFGTGNKYFSPYRGVQAENYEREISRFSAVANKPLIEYLLGADYQGDSRVRKILRSVLPLYLEINLEELSIRQADERADPQIFWQKVGQGEKRGQIISFIDEFAGENLWQKYQAFRTAFLAGRRDPGNLQQETKVLDEVERAAGLQDQEILFQAVALIKDLGFASVDDYLELMYGVSPDEVSQNMDSLLEVFASMTDKKGVKKLYLQRQLEATSDTDQSLPKEPLKDNLAQDLASLGIPSQDWDEKTALLTNVIPDVTTAQFAPVYYPPELSDQYPDLENDPVWKLLQEKFLFLLSRNSYQHPEDYRYLFHEAGHSLEVFLRLEDEQVAEQPLGLSVIGRPLVLREIFSLFYEARMPNKEYFIARERFLTARFAALAKHEITLWREAEKAVKIFQASNDSLGNKLDPKELRRRTLKAKTTFSHRANRSYKETLGRAVNAQVPTGRSVRDFFAPHASGQAASYAYGMLGALSMQQIVSKAQEPKATLKDLAASTTAAENISAVLQAMGTDFQQALQTLKDFFTQ